jgi:hypothetical protein
MSAYYRFPDYRLASGRWIRVEIFTQDISSGISAPYTDAGGRVDLPFNPWLQEGVPMAKQVAQPELGLIGTDACDFSFYGGELYGGKCLYCLIMEQPPDQFVWNIRYYTKPDAAATFPLRPQFWGILDRPQVDGDLKSMTRHELNKYKLGASNRLSLFERVGISDWTIPWKTTLAISPAAVYIDGLQLLDIMFTIPGSDSEDWIPSSCLRYLNLRDMLETMAAAIALATTVNKIDSVLSSWVFYGKDGSGVEHAYTFDDLVLTSGTEIPSGQPFTPGWYWHWSYFDHEKNGDYSIYDVESLLQVFKQLIAPFGLTAFIDTWHRTGDSFLAVREVQSRAGVVVRHLLRDKTLSPGEGSAKGLTVNIANDESLTIESTDGKEFDLCFQSATRLRAGDRWTHPDGSNPSGLSQDTDDLVCLFSSLYIYDSASNFVTNVTKIDVKTDGRDSLTVSPYAVTLVSGGKMIAEAVARYWFNPQNHLVSQLGYYRRDMQQLECRAHEIRDDIEGVTTNFVTGKLVCTRLFTEDEDTYLYRRVRNEDSGEETVITARDSDDQLSIADDIFALSFNHPFVILGPRVGDFAELPDGTQWDIRELTPNDRENTTDFLLETEAYL